MNQSSTSLSSAENTIILTPMDVERLLNDGSPDSRTAVLEKIAIGYNSDHLKGRERDIAEHIFRLLMKDVVLRVRETLAQRVKDNPATPRDIVLHLADDVESVATPVLASSTVLSDADLVGIVEKSHDMDKLLAITRRDAISQRVTGALVETRYAQVMTSLLANEGAVISERSLHKIADDFRGNAEVIGALSAQPQLPITLVERILSEVSGEVANALKAKYKLTDQDIAGDASQSREDFMVRLLERPSSPEEIAVLVQQMALEDRLTPSVVMTALCRGQLVFFTAAMAQFSSISIENAQRLVADRGEHGFNGLYQKSGLPESMMDAVRLLLRAVQDMVTDDSVPGSMLYANRLAERVINSAGSEPVEYLPYFIALIRQNKQRN
jgi:uncharacterized protein (DUF2336 family)